jgi:hypothetical protein
VEGSLSVLARRELNRRVLEALAAALDREVDLARLVHHAREAGDVEAVLRWAPEAARQARRWRPIARPSATIGRRSRAPGGSPRRSGSTCWRPTRWRPICRGSPPRRSRPAGPPWSCGRPPGTGSAAAARRRRAVRRAAHRLPAQSRTTPGFCGFQYVLAEHGRAVGILWYEQPEDLDGITQLVGSWFQDHIAPRLAGPETAVRGRVVINMTPPRTTRT